MATLPGPHRAGAVPDAAPHNWVDRLAPAATLPYLRLVRFDRPIGAWLLLFPCWWGQALAELSIGRAHPNAALLALFLAGAFLMRGAGCTYNDIVDKDYDAAVARTAARPIASGRISIARARLLLALLLLAGLIILLQLNGFAMVLGAASLLLVAVYPYMKRHTYWPQVVLGLAFSWGALLGWVAVAGSLSWAAIALYVHGAGPGRRAARLADTHAGDERRRQLPGALHFQQADRLAAASRIGRRHGAGAAVGRLSRRRLTARAWACRRR
jgi:4-hydroxybenzoate polyprenyltransferase